MLGAAAFIIPVSVVVSSFGAGNGSCFTSGRLSFAAARENHLPDLLAFIHISKYTPSPALIFNAILAILYVIPGNVGSLIDFFSFTAWLFYGLTMLALIRLRYKQPWKDRQRPYRVHLSVPIIVFVVSMYFVVAPIIEAPQIEYFYVLLYILSGLVAYDLFVKRRIRLTLLGKLWFNGKQANIKFIRLTNPTRQPSRPVHETVPVFVGCRAVRRGPIHGLA